MLCEHEERRVIRFNELSVGDLILFAGSHYEYFLICNLSNQTVTCLSTFSNCTQFCQSMDDYEDMHRQASIEIFDVDEECCSVFFDTYIFKS